MLHRSSKRRVVCVQAEYKKGSWLRIRTTDPIGLYIASHNVEEAQRCFESLVGELVARRELLVPKKDEHCILAAVLDWDAITLRGHGEVVVKTVVDTTAGKRGCSLQCNWWLYPNGAPFCVVRDSGCVVDQWFLTAVGQDV